MGHDRLHVGGGSARRQQRVCCERIICLWSDAMQRGWWHLLEDDQELLFADGGRIVEVPLAQAREATAEAVRKGYRPVLFVPNPTDWPRVYDALGPYRAYARLCVWTRDDEEMKALLHFPSAEVQSVFDAGRGTLIVPNLAYGRALDLLFDASLGDFVPESEPRESPNGVTFAYYSRLNPFRRLHVQLSAHPVEFRLRQFCSAEAEGAVEEACDLPIRVQNDSLKFNDRGECVLGEAQPDVVVAIIASLGLIEYDTPVAIAETVSRSVVPQLAKAVRPNAKVYFSRAQQSLLSAFSQSVEALQRLMQWVQNSTAPRPIALRLRRGLEPSATAPATGASAEQTQAAPVLPVLVTGLSTSGKDVSVSLVWTATPPDSPPELSIDFNDTFVQLSTKDIEWNSDCSGVHLKAPKELSGRELYVSWAWDEAKNELRLSLSDAARSGG